MAITGLVSVIIPTFNRAALCKNAVESVLDQSYPNVEIIIVDDGSTDNTEELLSGMDPRIRYVWQENHGVSAARNHGMQMATGEFIALLDSDDSWLPWKLELQTRVLKRFPDAGMVWSDMTAIDENGRSLYDSYLKRMYSAYQFFDAERDFRAKAFIAEVWDGCPDQWSKLKCYGGNIFPWMFMGNLVHTSTVLLRSERRERVGLFDIALLKSGEDYDFHLRTCRAGGVAYVDVPTIRYRVGAADQLTAGKYMHHMAVNNLTTVSRMLEQAREEIDAALPNSLISKRLAKCHSWVGMTEFLADRRSARMHFRKSLTYLPFQLKVMLFYLLTAFPTSFIDVLRRIKNSIVRAGAGNALYL